MKNYPNLMSQQLGSMPNLKLSSVESDGYTPYPTDVHTEVDLSFYDGQIADAQKSLDDATKAAADAETTEDLERATEKANQAKDDIDYWEHCRTQSEYDQTMDNIRTDKIINDCNKASNELHDVLNSIPQGGYTDYSDDILVQGMDWDSLAQQTFDDM